MPNGIQFFISCSLFGLLLNGMAEAYDMAIEMPDIDFEKIMMIESSGNPKAYNKKSQARGLYQITPIVLREWNQYHPRMKFKDNDLFNKQVNTHIAKWYLTKRIPQMLKVYKLPLTIENILISYNAGISKTIKGKIPKETQEYINKYKAK